MPDTLRERIAQAVGANVTNADGFPIVSYDDATRIINAILPVVEQAIQQEKERVFGNLESLANDQIDALQVQLGQQIRARHEAEAALAEKDAQLQSVRDERDELLREGVKWITDRAALQREIGVEVMARTDLPTVSSTMKRALEMTGCVGVADMAVELISARQKLAGKDAQIAALQAELDDFRRGQARHLSKMRPAGK